MEDKHRDLLQRHRSKFVQYIDIERLLPFLQATEILSGNDVMNIRSRAVPTAQVDALVDVLLTKDNQAFQTLCLALETTYPHLLTIMFLENRKDAGSVSMHTSDSEAEEIVRNSLAKDSSVGKLWTNNNYDSSQESFQRYHDFDSGLRMKTPDLKTPSHGLDRPNNILRQTEHHLGNQAKQGSDKSLSRDYERLKSQCDHAMAELQSLRRQHGDSVRRCEMVVKEGDFHKSQNKLAMSKIDQLQCDMRSMTLQYNDVITDRKRLEQEVHNMQKFREEDRKEINELRRQQQEMMSGGDPSASHANQLYVAAMRNYDALRDEYDTLRKRYSDVIASHSANVSKLELTQEEVSRLKSQNKDAVAERSAVVRECNGLKQQCTAAIRQWDSALRERNEAKEQLAKVKQQRDEATKEVNLAVAVRQKTTKDLTRVTEERDAAMNEYRLIMSERDTVHKEIERLQEELGEGEKKFKMALETQRKSTLDEIETLRRELSLALLDRDKSSKECQALRIKYGESERDSDYHSVHDSLSSMSDLKRSLQSDNSSTSSGKATMSSCSGGNGGGGAGDLKISAVESAAAEQLTELDRLRKQVDKLQAELTEAQQEVDVCKRRRDWAFSERDKIVLERESIRTLCDRLRRERDRAVSDLAEALRDCDDVKKQRNEASKQVKDLREKLDAQIGHENRARRLDRNYSRDSAIDMDHHDYELETVDLEVRTPLPKSPPADSDFNEWGLEFANFVPFEAAQGTGVTLIEVATGSLLSNKVRCGDNLLRVNGIDVVDRGDAWEKLKEASQCGSPIVVLTVRRRRLCRSSIPVQLVVSSSDPNSPRNREHHGLCLDMAIYVSKVIQGSPAAREGTIGIGDKIVSINGAPVDGRTLGDTVRMLDSNQGEVILVSVIKAKEASTTSGHSSASGSGVASAGSSSSPVMNPMAPLSISNSRQNVLDTSFGYSPKHRMSNSSGNSPRPQSMLVSPNHAKKLVTSSSQTEDTHRSSAAPPAQQTKQQYNLFDRAYQKIFRSSNGSAGSGKEKKSGSRKGDTRSPAPPPPPQQEIEALAELDSVLDDYKSPYGTVGRSKGKSTTRSSSHRSSNRPYSVHEMPDQDVSHGTWPKYKGPPVELGVGTGTVMHHPRARERMPLSAVLQRQAQMEQAERDMGYEDMVCKKMMYGSPDSDRFPASASESNKTLDFTVVSANRQVDVLEQYCLSRSNRPRPKSAFYAAVSSTSYQSDSDQSQMMTSPAMTSSYMTSSDATSQVMTSSATPPQLDMSGSAGSGQFLKPSSLELYKAHLYGPNTWTTVPRGGHYVLGNMATASPGTVQTGSISPSPASLGATPDMFQSVRYSAYSPYHTTQRAMSPLDKHGPDCGGHYSTPRTTAGNQASFGNHPSPPSEFLDYYSPEERKTYQQRIRIPSSHSVASRSTKMSSSSIDDRDDVISPPPPAFFITSTAVPSTNTSAPSGSLLRHSSSRRRRRAAAVTGSSSVSRATGKSVIGKPREIRIEKSAEPLGIQIDCGPRGGIYVSTVTADSLAARAGLQVGDQLLEVCGINLRNATFRLAANVLQQCGDSITMLVQFNPDKCKEVCGWSSSEGENESKRTNLAGGARTVTESVGVASTGGGSGGASCSIGSSATLDDVNRHTTDDDRDGDDEDQSPTPTPRCTPPPLDLYAKAGGGGDHSDGGRMMTMGGTLTRQQIQHAKNLDHNEPRYVFVNKSSNLGISLVGGNAVGIFVHQVQADSPANGPNGLKSGDLILEFNGTDLRGATAEQAAYELAKPCDGLRIRVQHCPKRYSEVQQGGPGDSFYIRAMFDRTAENEDELSFRANDIIYVDNTMQGGVPGVWRAWLVDEDGDRSRCGLIPSKYRVEEQLALRRSLGELDRSTSRRSSNSSTSSTARRSFFRRRSKHSRSASRGGSSNDESRELACFSDMGGGNCAGATDALMAGDGGDDVIMNLPATYQRVHRLDCSAPRPVVIIGPLAEILMDRLLQEYPFDFGRCAPVLQPSDSFRNQSDLDKAVQQGIFVDWRRRGGHFECTTLRNITDVCDKNCHCIVDLSASGVERLHHSSIYPIVLLVRFRSTRQIRDARDSHRSSTGSSGAGGSSPLTDKLSSKAAKEMYEHAQKTESEYKHLVTAVIPGGSVAYMCTQLKSRVEQEQNKTLWVAKGCI